MFTGELAVARNLQPLFGSSASVWTTSLMFFQLLLLLGYLGAARWPALTGPRGELLHAAVVLLPLLTFPFAYPVLDVPRWLAVVASLSLSVAPAFLVLSTTSVLTQRWFSQSGHPARLDPYFLYGVSNVGSLAALVVYPLLVEPLLGMRVQLGLWYGLYVVFAALHFIARPRRPQPLPAVPDAPAHAGEGTFTGWLLFSAGGSTMLPAVTNVITADASMPLLWALPLAVYLLTFVITFARVTPPWSAVVRLSVGALALSAVAFGLGQWQKSWLQPALVVAHTAVLFVACLLCHWNLVRLRPAQPSQLGRFYFAMSLGGFLGTALIALLVPMLFARVAVAALDYALAGVVLVSALLYRDRVKLAAWARAHRLGAALGATVTALFVGLVVLVFWAQVALQVYGVRTFYGLHTVKDEDGYRWLQHGNTVHGIEALDERGVPRGYYHRTSHIAQYLNSAHVGARVGVVGLGAGGLAGWSREGQQWEFFELDPEVEHIARSYFGFMEKLPASSSVVIGDARLTLADVPEGHFDTLVLDAFSSDFVPTHLLTKEAMALYKSRLQPGGRLVFHASNRLFELRPVVGALAESVGLRAECGGGLIPSAEALADASFAPLRADLALQPVVVPPGARVWTDDYINLLGALRY